MPLVENNFETPDALNADFAQQIGSILSTAIELNGAASIAVSGGRTPLALFQTLSQLAIDWSKVVVTLADERWVNGDHPDSNEKLVRENLLVGRAADARFFALKTSHDNAFDAVEHLTSSSEQPRMPFDVLILGMGEDAHTASLFPCCDQIEQGLNMQSGQRFIATEPKTAPHQRMSYTLPALVESKHIFLHLTGDKKRTVLHDALRSANEQEKPIKAVVDKAVVTLMWAP
ncbi:6-phosphogluconolactonase [Alteromonas oceanisediminis]|uniref:6-phosphogluconolactonase n=1 Tax=Alteromonas oceanisediminis TaxID=2836180 RepID=UPI001BD9F017|nr:6-phosphogluconolactonase [Alteromonas oceanisediminis]MBT0586561.1 6-phosphogluconolactonase [Alteromonas oceanisediminis]